MLKTATIAAALLVAAAVPGTARAQGEDASPTTAPATVPPAEPFLGRSLGEWAARWAPWSSQPGAVECAPSEDDRLWFLPGVAANEPNLADVRIPCALLTGTALFVPIVVHQAVGAEACQAQGDLLLAGVGGIEGTRLEVDGQSVPDLDAYRFDPLPLVAAEPATPEDAVATPDADTVYACGRAALIAPLPAGDHTVTLTIETGGATIIGITHEIAVEGSA